MAGREHSLPANIAIFRNDTTGKGEMISPKGEPRTCFSLRVLFQCEQNKMGTFSALFSSLALVMRERVDRLAKLVVEWGKKRSEKDACV
jgi:hypothetical protein